MTTETEPRCECGARITDTDTGARCTACHAEYWAMWCEECNAEPDQECAPDCPNWRE